MKLVKAIGILAAGALTFIVTDAALRAGIVAFQVLSGDTKMVYHFGTGLPVAGSIFISIGPSLVQRTKATVPSPERAGMTEGLRSDRRKKGESIAQSAIRRRLP